MADNFSDPGDWFVPPQMADVTLPSHGAEDWFIPGAPAKTSSKPDAAPPMTAGETAMDVAKSAGVGLGEGVLGLGTSPGNIEQLGRLGINKGAEMLGYKAPLSEDTYLPTLNDAKRMLEPHTGKFYEPKSTAGEYARTIGEFAPMALAPGGAVARAANVLGPALADETAGQVTKGTSLEPWARAAGALAGGFAPAAAMRAITPVAPLVPDAVQAAHVANLQGEGVNALTAGQRTGGTNTRWLEDAATKIPLGPGDRMNVRAAGQFTRAALRHAGIDAERSTPAVIDQGFDRLGNTYDTIGSRNTVHADTALTADVRGAVRAYHNDVGPALRAPAIENIARDIFDKLSQNNGSMPGAEYLSLRSQIGRAARANRSNVELSRAYGDLNAALDGAMMRSAVRNGNPNDAALLRQTNLQYRNLLAIEKASTQAGENAANGYISPAALRQAVLAQNRHTFATGQRDLGELARSGTAILSPLKSSGTAERSGAMRIFNALGVGGGAGFVAGGPAAAVGTAAAIAAPGVAARMFMSRPMQAVLANERMVPAMNAYNAGRVELTHPLGYGYRLPQALAEAAQGASLHGRQTQGAYPPGDPRWLEYSEQ